MVVVVGGRLVVVGGAVVVVFGGEEVVVVCGLVVVGAREDSGAAGGSALVEVGFANGRESSRVVATGAGSSSRTSVVRPEFGETSGRDSSDRSGLSAA